MSRQSRSVPPPSSPTPQHGSKLSKFLHKQSRDRSKSLTDPAATDSTASIASSSSSVQTSNSTSARSHGHSSSRNDKSSSGNSKEDKSTAPDGDSESEDGFDETPVIVEPSDSPRTRTWSGRPLSTISDIRPTVSMYSPSSSRISDLPTRLSGWLSHTFSSSSTDLTLPSILSQSQMAAASPKSKSNALLTAAKHGKGHLDRAMRFILDSDATPDKCSDPIWLLGVQHPGYEPPPPATPGRRPSVESRRALSFRSNTSSSATVSEHSQSQPSSGKNPAPNWPPVFYADFTSRIWLTYRSQFPPIRDSHLSTLESDLESGVQAATPSSPRPRKWNWPGTGEKGWTSDAGWGCMLRTGQSLLANALLHLHLGREWRRPPYPVRTNDFATYVQIITWFLDSPLPQAPFSVHRMALAGKDLGKDVGQWFGPSTAAGAIKALVHAFPEAGLGVAVAADGVVYQSDVYAASNVHIGSPRRHAKSSWGGRAVLVLIGIRLGLDGVNPIYYEPIKALYTFPQSVGIAGGRPSSSYYFMGSQADNLFYLDPHHARPAVPLRPAPPSPAHDYPTVRSRETTPDNASDLRAATRSPGAHSSSSSHHNRAPTSPSSVRTGSSTFSYHAPLSPSPLQHQLSTSSSVSSSSASSQHPSRWQNASMPASPSPAFSGSDLDPRELGVEEEELDPIAEHYVTQYGAADLRTFHCDRVRKMPLSGLDPSMLIGFLCRDEKDWIDLRHRMNELNAKYKTIFTIQDEPPSWPSDSDEFMGLESISDPDDMDMEPEEDADVDGLHDAEKRPSSTNDNEDQFFETRSTSISPVGSSFKGGAKGSEADTEEDPIGPITPGPNSTFEVDKQEEEAVKGLPRNEDFEEIDGNEGEDDDEWVDPSMPTPLAQSIERPYAPPMAKSISTESKESSGSKKGKKGRKSKKSNVPLVKAPSPPMKPEEHFPFPRSLEQSFYELPDETTNYEKRMNNARARDGGRTESGGVKAVLTEDIR